MTRQLFIKQLDRPAAGGKLRQAAGVLMGLDESISLGGSLGKETAIMYLSSAAKALDENGPEVQPMSMSIKALYDAANVLLDCMRDKIGLGIPLSEVGMELVGYLEILDGQKGRIGKLHVYSTPPQVIKVRTH